MSKHIYIVSLRYTFLALVLFAGQTFAQAGARRYIVELTSEPVADHIVRTKERTGVRGALAEAHRSVLHAEQGRAAKLASQRSAKVLDHLDNIANALIVESSDPAQLASIPGVKRVHRVRYYRPLLDRAVVIHKVSDVWNQVGESKAGAGMKVGIIDTGIEIGHPAFQDASLTIPDGFPKVNNTQDTAYTNNKVIVARSYVNLLDNADPDMSVRDHVGHGTALATIVAGVRNTGPLATIEGVAPRAYLGVYKVFGTPGSNDGASDAAILKAVDDAVADGMDVISLSLGVDAAPRVADDLDAQALERAVQSGVIVVVAAGNNGTNPNTIASPGTAPSVITAGASTNDRTFGYSVTLSGGTPVTGFPGTGPAPASPTISGQLVDVASIDTTGLTCDPLPAGSLSGKVALILRGTCTFSTKLNNAQQAGAIAGIIYTAADADAPFVFGAGTATLPAIMIDHASGVQFAAALKANPGTTASLNFTLSPVPAPGNLITDFSAAGPNVDLGIKPDLMAVGGNIYVGTQTFDSQGDMYDSSGYILVDGTSFSTPLIAGAAALIKAARPGLTVDQYRSLLINSGAPMSAITPVPTVQRTGVGLLDANAAYRQPVTVTPVSISWGSDTTPGAFTRTLTLTNVSQSADTFSLDTSLLHGSAAPSFSQNTVQLAPGASANVTVSWNGNGLAAGTYDGYIKISSAAQNTVSRVPYWYAVSSGDAAFITVLYNVDDFQTPHRGASINDAIDVRVTDANGVIVPVPVTATVVSGGGRVRGVTSFDSEVPGDWGINVTLGARPGPNVFAIQAGNVSIQATINGN